MKKPVLTRRAAYRAALGFAVTAFLASVAMIAWQFMPHPLTIVEDANGFHPRTLTIHAGQTVTFKSVRGKYFWPASDFHPTHLLHPKFDPKEPIAPSGSWSYTFPEAGVYPFHDHLAAYYMGQITVLDANGQVVNDCMKGGQLTCWQNELFAALAQGGPNAAYDKLGELFRSDPGFADNCHYLTHNLGLATYQFYKKDPTVVLSPKAIACAGGFYHGFMEGYLGATGDIAGAARICDTIGAKIGADVPDARYQCYHGIGHGAIETQVASTGNFDSLNESVQLALGLCEKASTGTQERYRCSSGVFNALANFYVAGEYGLSVKTTDPLALCARQPDVYKEPCYGNMNAVVIWEGKNDLAQSLPYLLRIPDVDQRSMAVQYLTGLFAIQYVGTTTPFAPIIAQCRADAGSYALPCLQGFAHGLLEHGTPGAQYVRAIQFCADPQLHADERHLCYTEVLSHLDLWYAHAQAVQICASLTPEQRAYCAPEDKST